MLYINLLGDFFCFGFFLRVNWPYEPIYTKEFRLLFQIKLGAELAI